MKNLSITTFVHLIFAFALVATASAFIAFVVIDKEKLKEEEIHRHAIIAKTFLKDLKYFPSDYELEEMYKNLGLKEVVDFEAKLEVLNNASLEHIQENLLGRFRVFVYNDHKYLYIQKYGYNILLEDSHSNNSHWKIILLIASIAMGFLVVLYVAILKKLSPLRRLNIAINRFSSGDFSTQFEVDGNDEIGRIAKSFNKAKLHIKELIESKNLFMRNMLHELKTPITKGRILAEYLEDTQKRERLIKTFEDMNTMITNLSTIEKIAAKKYHIQNDAINLSKLVALSCESLYLEEDNVELLGEDVEFVGDLPLMTIALKNLIDNAIKFGADQKAVVVGLHGKIEVRSNSEALKNGLEYYLEPFSQEKKNNKGFGLGLYIVDKILSMHHFSLEYYHEEGESRFVINLKP